MHLSYKSSLLKFHKHCALMAESDSSLQLVLALARLFLSPSAWGPLRFLSAYSLFICVPASAACAGFRCHLGCFFFLFSFFYVILLFPHSLFGPELFPPFFFPFRLTHFSLFIPLAVYFIMQKLQNRNLFSFTLLLYM